MTGGNATASAAVLAKQGDSTGRTQDSKGTNFENFNDMPLASKETVTLDSHRPLTYET